MAFIQGWHLFVKRHLFVTCFHPCLRSVYIHAVGLTLFHENNTPYQYALHTLRHPAVKQLKQYPGILKKRSPLRKSYDFFFKL